MISLVLTYLIHAAISLCLAALVVALLLKITAVQSASLHKIAWLSVVLQSVLFGFVPLNIPISITQDVAAKTEIPPVVEKGGALENTAEVRPQPIDTEIAVHGVLHSAPAVIPEPKTSITETHSKTTRGTISWTTVVVSVWCAGILLLLGVKAVAYFRLLRVVRKATPAAEEFRTSWDHLLESHGVTPGSIPLLTTEKSGPLTLRMINGKTVILVPQTVWEELSENVRLGILRHELGHYRNCDCTASFFVQLLTYLQWFNPPAWFACHKFLEAAEWNADEFAFDCVETAPYDFAETLLCVNANRRRITLHYQSFFGGNLRRRLDHLTRYHTFTKETIMKKTLILTVCGMLVFCGLFRIELVAEEKKTAKPQPPKSPLEVPVEKSDEFKVEKYAVGKKIKDFTKSDDFSTPEAAYVSIERLGIEGKLDWKAVSIKRFEPIFKSMKIEPPVSTESEEIKNNTEIVNVRIHENHARVAAYVSGPGVKEPYFDLRSFEKENGKWVNSGNDVTSKLENDDAKFKIICDYAKERETQKKQQSDILNSYAQRIKTYDVNKSTADFPVDADFSTPEGLCVYVNRKIADGDVDALNKVNKHKTPAGEAARIKNPDKQWSEVLRNAKIQKVRIFADRFVVVSQLLEGENIRSPYDIRVMEYQNGKWVNCSNDRYDSDEEVGGFFADSIISWDEHIQEEKKTAQEAVTPLRGRVVNSETGEGVAGVQVQFIPADSDNPGKIITTTTDKDGYYVPPFMQKDVAPKDKRNWE